MNRDDILKLQCIAGWVLLETCVALQLSREDFSDTLAKYLSAGKETEKTEKAEKAEKKEGIAGATVLGYFQKLPKKYLVPEEGFELFRMVLENAIQDLCDGKGSCNVNEKAVRDSWGKYGDTILGQLDMLHRKAADIHMRAVIVNSRQIIEDFLAE